ncbi:MAG: hypothetical protein J2P45_07940, partial [Candidatus Dormibacteraeota bacterium]|nr:hypothetical protein [Candidatus Dormibacteraeota bacterium]
AEAEAGEQPSARWPDEVAHVRRTARGLEAAMAFGLDVDCCPDPDLGLLRGHARNVALVMRRSINAGLAQDVEPRLRAHELRRALRFGDDLVAALGGFQGRVGQLAAGLREDPWSPTAADRLLAIAAWLLPARQRRDFVEDQCANLRLVESRAEWARYVAGLLLRMPSIAAAAAGSGREGIG